MPAAAWTSEDEARADVQRRWRSEDQRLRVLLGVHIQDEVKRGTTSAWLRLSRDVDSVVGPLVQSVLECRPQNIKDWCVTELEGKRPVAFAQADGDASHESLAASTSAILQPLIVEGMQQGAMDVKAFLLGKLKS